MKRTVIDINQQQPVLVFGGPYSNLSALKALKACADDYQIPAKQIICTVDIFAYCAEPQACIDFIQSWGIHCIKGNCEDAIINGDEDCGCGFEENSVCSMLSNQWYRYCNAHINADAKVWLGQLNDQIIFDYRNKNIICIHASIDSNNEFIYQSHSTQTFLNNFENSQADIIIAGHSGLPFNKSIQHQGKSLLWHNPGVIGMPANDGTVDGWYSIIEPDEYCQQQFTIHTKRLNYNFLEACQAMEINHCSAEYSKCIKTGLWPSLDTLPTKEKSMTGIALDEFQITITDD